MVSRRSLLTLAVGAALTVTACGSDAVFLRERSDTLSAEEVATAAEDALERGVGARPEISCPEELAKEEGATTRCTLTAEDDSVQYGVTVTIASADGRNRISVEVDDEPLG
ncbi:DUF4333 domain-containing protein [Blastococcus goldschmidtiae]|uniref:DUF4333 domain-containing protein n=1 Tax=Blastococcus goldschmidtiae TaxID=3075546 RepID=A0ABU2KDC5_9ACTN|nr:DUF4333 domain-containing protein [Blastococcus sp. DSM 46792]MDT0278174.1 DUF4333 domain-containing protein [Blastococcus sp. DSM 46792]